MAYTTGSIVGTPCCLPGGNPPKPQPGQTKQTRRRKRRRRRRRGLQEATPGPNGDQPVSPPKEGEHKVGQAPYGAHPTHNTQHNTKTANKHTPHTHTTRRRRTVRTRANPHLQAHSDHQRRRRENPQNDTRTPHDAQTSRQRRQHTTQLPRAHRNKTSSSVRDSDEGDKGGGVSPGTPSTTRARGELVFVLRGLWRAVMGCLCRLSVCGVGKRVRGRVSRDRSRVRPRIV